MDIQGPGANVLTVSGNNAQQVFQVNSGVTATISGFTITNGYAPSSGLGSGGGIEDEGNLTVDHCAFTKNSAPNGYGGAIEDDGLTGNPTFQNNSAQWGGAVNSTSTLAVTGSSFEDNSASAGGGGAIAYAPFVSPATPATITSSTISGNTAAYAGGGKRQPKRRDDHQ